MIKKRLLYKQTNYRHLRHLRERKSFFTSEHLVYSLSSSILQTVASLLNPVDHFHSGQALSDWKSLTLKLKPEKHSNSLTTSSSSHYRETRRQSEIITGLKNYTLVLLISCEIARFPCILIICRPIFQFDAESKITHCTD